MTTGAALLSSAGSSTSGGWSFGEAFYFCFLSLLTVGHGGLRPSESDIWPCVLYILFGVAVVATCAFIIREDVFERVGRIKLFEQRRKESLN